MRAWAGCDEGIRYFTNNSTDINLNVGMTPDNNWPGGSISEKYIWLVRRTVWHQDIKAQRGHFKANRVNISNRKRGIGSHATFALWYLNFVKLQPRYSILGHCWDIVA